MDIQDMKERANDLGFVGERKAIALLCLGFFTTLFFVNAMFSPLPEWTPFFAGLAVCWGLAFFALAASWFWGRWYAVGLGNFGWTTAAWVMLKAGLNTPIIVFGILHAIIAVVLLGKRMAVEYEARPEWRERWHIDEQGVLKVRRAVTWVATSLPVIIMMALAPRGDEESRFILAAAVAGFGGLLLRRTWSLFVLAGAGVGALAACWHAPAGLMFAIPTVPPIAVGTLAFVAGSLLLGAVAPFVVPMASYLGERR